jgi:hypothetical protein
LLVDKDKESEMLKERRVELQNRITKGDLIILSTNLLTKMLRASIGGGEVKYFYLKTEDGIVTGYETDITRSNSNNSNRDNATTHFNQ